MFLVERSLPGFNVSRKLDKTGMRASDTAELSFQDVGGGSSTDTKIG